MIEGGVEPWVVLATIGAIAQTTRNATAQTISREISPALNSWSRFAFCLPYAALAAIAVGAMRGWPSLSASFLGFCALTAVTQLLANVALITAFRAGSFGESIVFHKLEVVLTALVGGLLFAERPSRIGALGIVVCAIGVIAINLAREGRGTRLRSALSFGRAGRYALLCASLLVVASFALKFANQALRGANPEADFFEGAVHTLFHTTWIEVALLSAWLARNEQGALASIRRHAPRMALIGSAGFTASLCWFWSFSLTIVAYAKAVGQIEALLAVVLGIRMMGERTLVRQLPGVALTVVGIVLVLLD